MGVLHWMVRKGTVGGTARWAAKGYLAALDREPLASTEDIISSLISARYSVVRGNDAEMNVRSLVADMPGLYGFVISVLMVEASYSDNTFENQNLFNDVIEEELEKAGAPYHAIFGDTDLVA